MRDFVPVRRGWRENYLAPVRVLRAAQLIIRLARLVAREAALPARVRATFTGEETGRIAAGMDLTSLCIANHITIVRGD